MTDWVRLWHDMPTDPKWRVIARKSGQPLPSVIAVFTMLMVSASQNADERGCLMGWDDEDAAAALDMEPEAVSAIIAAMQGKVLDGERLSGWERRQPKREDNSYDRVKAYRDRKRAEANANERDGTRANDVKRDVTQRNAPDADADADAEDNPPPPLVEEKGDYPFIGKVARLNRRDYNRFRKQFHAIPDFDAALTGFDGWLSGQSPAKQAKWFGSCAPWLEKRHQEAVLAQKARAGPAPVVGL